MIKQLQTKLHSLIDSNFRPQQFFKPYSIASCEKFIGVRMPDIRSIVKEFKHITLLQHRDVLKQLLQSEINEERMLALLLLVQDYKKNANNIYEFYIKNIDAISNWNLVDASAHLIIGAHYMKAKDSTQQDSQKKDTQQQDVTSTILSLANSKNFWHRRIAMVSMWLPIKKASAKDKQDLALTLATMLMNDEQELVCKAVGWMVREMQEPLMLDFLNTHYKDMSRIALRNILEAIPKEKRSAYL